MTASSISIVPFSTLPHSGKLEAALDRIFFEASATRSFASDEARARFRHRWLGAYLEREPEHAFLALAGGDPNRVAGYLVGALADPALDPRHAELGYFEVLAPMTRRYPAHLHINLAPEFRSVGTGARLIEAFAAHAAERGAPGVHVITSKGMRNVGFYLRNGFEVVQEVDWQGRVLLMLGRKLMHRL